MQLRFYAKQDLLVALPRQTLSRRNADTGESGAPVRYVGRVHIPAVMHDHNGRTIIDQQACNPATPAPFECDSESDRGRRLMKLVRRDAALWPADKATADACGVQFVETVFADGAHVEKSKAKPEAKAEPASGTGRKSEASA